MAIAVLGATGQLGTAVCALLGDRATPVPRRVLDLTKLSSISPWVESTKPDAIINCAAYTAVDAAEKDERSAHLLNALTVEQLALASRAADARFITFSTDYVFDGTKRGPYLESDAPNPLSAYGRSKFEGERMALAANPDALIIRTAWVLSGTHRNFASTMLDLIRKGTVKVVDDQRGRPTIAKDLASTTVECLDLDSSGILHVTNQGETTWFQLARAIAELAGLDTESVLPTTTAEFPRPARRPANSVLESERLPDLGLSPLPHHLVSLEAVVRDLIQAGF